MELYGFMEREKKIPSYFFIITNYIKMYNGTNESYFADYKGGTVSIVNTDTEEYVYNEIVK